MARQVERFDKARDETQARVKQNKSRLRQPAMMGKGKARTAWIVELK